MLNKWEENAKLHDCICYHLYLLDTRELCSFWLSGAYGMWDAFIDSLTESSESFEAAVVYPHFIVGETEAQTSVCPGLHNV